MNSISSQAPGSGARLASYYARHHVLLDGTAYTWRDQGRAVAALSGLVQVGASQDAWYALRGNGELVRWAGEPAQRQTTATAAAVTPVVLMRGVRRFACGQSGWFAIDAHQALWYAAAGGNSANDTVAPTRVATDVATACIGDSADYYITRDGRLFVKGLAHRGQYGDGKLTTTGQFVATARDALEVRAHTGHAIYLARDGTVFGTGGNRYGPLSAHGLGDKADRWGPIFSGAVAVATGSRHSAALRGDGSLWVWGEGFAIEPQQVMTQVAEVAAGDTATIALGRDNALWQWERGRGPERVVLG